MPRRVAPSRTVRLVVALTLTIVPWLQADAQLQVPPINADCEYIRVIAPPSSALEPAWRPYHPSVQRASLQALLDSGAWNVALDSVRARFERAVLLSDALRSDPASSMAFDHFRHQLDSAHARLSRFVASKSTDDYGERIRFIGPKVFDAQVSDARAVLFRDKPDEVVFTDASSQGARRAVCYHAATMQFVLFRITDSSRVAAAALLESKRVSWTHYFDRGYSQLPWELLLNSQFARKSTSLDPPTSQIILLHPSVGLEVPTRSIRDLTRQDAVALELLGFIKYRNDYQNYLGLSGVVTFTEGLGTGIGPFVHFGRVAKVGYVFRARHADASGARKQDGVLISVDLYKYLTDRKAQVEKALGDVRTKVGGS